MTYLLVQTPLSTVVADFNQYHYPTLSDLTTLRCLPITIQLYVYNLSSMSNPSNYSCLFFKYQGVVVTINYNEGLYGVHVHDLSGIGAYKSLNLLNPYPTLKDALEGILDALKVRRFISPNNPTYLCYPQLAIID